MSNAATTNGAAMAGGRRTGFRQGAPGTAREGPDGHAARLSHDLRWELVERLARLRSETRLEQPLGSMAVTTRPNLPAGPPRRRR